MAQMMNKNGVWIDGVRFFNGDRCDCLFLISERLKRGKATAVYTPNPVMLENAARHPWFRAVLGRADLNLPDGVGVLLAARLLGERLFCRLSGVDVAKSVLTLAAARGYRVFFLGGRPGIAEEAANKLISECPSLTVCGVHDGYFSAKTEGVILEKIRRTGADILFVCLGSPKQEVWIDRHRRELPDVKLFMALGGTLDVFAGKVKRAPLPIQNMGLEWLWRMAHEPRRLRDLSKMVAFSGRMMQRSLENLVILHRGNKQKIPF